MRLGYAGVIASLLLPVAAARGQEAATVPTVANRIAEDFEPIGGRIGTIFLYPEFTALATGTDNVLATEGAKIEDVYLTLNPAIRVISLEGEDRYTLYSYFAQTLHADQPREDAAEFGVRGFARIGGRKSSNLVVTITGDRLIDSRESTNTIDAARSPIRRARFSSAIAYTYVAQRWSLTGTVRGLGLDYYNGRDRAGGFIDQEYRDYHQLGGGMEFRYAMPNGFAVVARGSYDRVRYDFGPEDALFNPAVDADRDSRRVRAEAGLAYEIDEFISGDVTVGYLERRFVRQPIPLRDPSGVSFSANLVWNVNPATSLRFAADRDFLESAQRSVSGLTSTGGSFEVEHAPTRSLVLSGRGSVYYIDPNGPGRKRLEFGGALAATWHVSRRYRLLMEARYSGRDSNDPAIEYGGFYLTGGIKATF